MYIKTIIKGNDRYGYVLLSKDSIMSLSDSIDYLKIRRHGGIGSELSFLIDPNKPDELYIYAELEEIHSVNYRIVDGVDPYETLFYENSNIGSPYAKVPYIQIGVLTIDPNSLLIKDSNARTDRWISPIWSIRTWW